jgi:hypothetical protein
VEGKQLEKGVGNASDYPKGIAVSLPYYYEGDDKLGYSSRARTAIASSKFIPEFDAGGW